jgi:enoyl-[acyl-carrier-protein] reductase (NADH)
MYMAKELGSRGITVNTVAPGAIETDFGGGAVRDNPDINKTFAGMTALGRVGLPDDIGPMIASLLSQDNRWVNAQRIEVSGGQKEKNNREQNENFRQRPQNYDYPLAGPTPSTHPAHQANPPTPKQY